MAHHTQTPTEYIEPPLLPVGCKLVEAEVGRCLSRCLFGHSVDYYSVHAI